MHVAARGNVGDVQGRGLTVGVGERVILLGGAPRDAPQASKWSAASAKCVAKALPQ